MKAPTAQLGLAQTRRRAESGSRLHGARCLRDVVAVAARPLRFRLRSTGPSSGLNMQSRRFASALQPPGSPSPLAASLPPAAGGYGDATSLQPGCPGRR